MKVVLAIYKELLDVLPAGARRFTILFAVLQATLALLDAAALGLLALVIAPLSSGGAVVLPVIGEVDTAGAFISIGVVCLLVVVKGLLSVLLLWWATRRFARFELEIGNRLFRSYMAAPWVERLKRNSSDVVRLADGSVNIAIISFLLPGSTILGEVASLIAVVTVLAIVQPLLAVVTFLYLGAIGAVLYFWIARHSRIAGQTNLKYTLQTSRFITEMIGAMKEVILRNKNAEVVEVVNQGRAHSTRARANINFLAQVPRFVLESGIIGGFVLVGVIGFLVGGASAAMTSIALFGLAGFRMAPSVIRLQAILSQLLSSAPHPKAVISEIRAAELASGERSVLPARPLPENPQRIEVRDVSFHYAEGTPPAVSDVSLSIPFGSTVAFVGQSGSGKSTIIDLILGLVEPSGGEILIDDTSIAHLTTAWRERIGYVPQDVSLFDGTIAQNVALSWQGEVDKERVRDALRQAQLLAVVEARPDGLDARVGERGLALSGGQRQRLGIARALYARPWVLVMDEATSALDTKTESAVMSAIAALNGSLTVILVAHRLATVKDADQVFYLRDGGLAGSGKFNDVVAAVPEFAQQAALAGLV